MKGIVLAAGRGSRLGPETLSVPKPLIEVGTKACLDFALSALMPVVDEILVVTGYFSEKIDEHLAQHWDGYPVRTVLNPTPEAGNLTSLGAVRDQIANGAFIVTNADHLFPDTMYTDFFPPAAGVRIACERNREILSDEMKVTELNGYLREISKTLPHFTGAYIGTTMVGNESSEGYWAAFDQVMSTQDLRLASVEMVLGQLAQKPEAAPQVCWIDGLRWFEVDTAEDLAIARSGLLT